MLSICIILPNRTHLSRTQRLCYSFPESFPQTLRYTFIINPQMMLKFTAFWTIPLWWPTLGTAPPLTTKITNIFVSFLHCSTPHQQY
ncbi:hypothetical protein D081_0801 [Anaerovibrio sp. JC8]|nr:hypothetical protein D081_0801 [Anaerovibrio sp. JC8]